MMKARFWDYFILSARVLLAWTFINYGYAKLMGGQFGLTPAQAALPVSQLGLFKLSFYLFAQEPFKSFVGVSQILAGLLLLWNRTALLGAFLLLPIAANVLVIDITYISILPGFQWRLSFYIGLILLIFWHYRNRMIAAARALTHGLTTHFPYPWWAYALLPVAAIGVEVAGTMPRLVYLTILHPIETARSFQGLIHSLVSHLTQ